MTRLPQCRTPSPSGPPLVHGVRVVRSCALLPGRQAWMVKCCVLGSGSCGLPARRGER